MARKNLLKGFKRPKGLTFEHGELKANYGKFVASPFEPGFGATVGNTLRRVLLSSIQGYAITAVKLTTYSADGGPHIVSSEFETVDDIVEDTLEVLNNLKQVRVKLPGDAEEGVFLYEWTGKREVTSDDFARPEHIEVLSPDQHIMTLAEGAKVEVEIQVNLGRGYVPSDTNDRYIEVIGTIPMDAIFSPVKRVKYAVEPCRVGQRNDYDKLVLEVWTDGTVRPDEALAEAAKIAKEHFSVFINFDEDSLGDLDDFDEDDDRIRKILNTPVEELELSVRSSNCLKNANIKVLGELIRKSEDDITKTRNFGKKSLQEIKEKLREWGLDLGITDLGTIRDAVKIVADKDGEDEA
ncbi:MAG: DNA-directed RNA polymerase subunit alpha [Treponema sp.]|jgi:DNA-directed RNA polymerase subunit alpha|nr:DNA-directed RNA polymerase subunit alpha [Treponema sp.]